MARKWLLKGIPSLKTSYEIISNPPSPLSWEEYNTRLESAWKKLLDSADASVESKIHKFLEKHPCLLPGTYGMNLPSGHDPFPKGVISQPILNGLTTKYPDFMWIGVDSSTLFPVLIEIETPDKRWFTKKGIPTSEFTQAQDQLASWKTWFNSPANQHIFMDYYKIPTNWRTEISFEPEYVLIYGRRDEFSEKPSLNLKRNSMARQNEYLMTFDRLKPQYNAKNKCSLKINDDGYEAIAFPATFILYPNNSKDLSLIKNKDTAVRNSEWMSEERKEFLIERFPYWDSLGRTGNIGWVRNSDFE